MSALFTLWCWSRSRALKLFIVESWVTAGRGRTECYRCAQLASARGVGELRLALTKSAHELSSTFLHFPEHHTSFLDKMVFWCLDCIELLSPLALIRILSAMSSPSHAACSAG